MARSKQTSQKGEREKKKKQKQKEKEEKRALRKENSVKGKTLEQMMAYVDHNGRLSDTPPDPKLRVEIKAEDIQLIPTGFRKEELHVPKTGRVAIYNEDRRFGFIKEGLSQEKIFFHISDAYDGIKEGDNVTFETRRGPRGMNAVEITKQEA
ncbi:MAG: cold-shock protein [Bacteroidia bacterium]